MAQAKRKEAETQADLFGPAAAPVYRPHPDRVRPRLVEILAEMRAAPAELLEPSRLSLFRIIVPQFCGFLPAEEGARWRAEFDAELGRLGVE